MIAANLLEVDGLALRANPLYDLVPFEMLEAELQLVCTPFMDDADFCGILLPRLSTLRLKVADRETARLFVSIRDAKQLAAGPLQASTGTDARLIARLICDGILEMQDTAGVFLSGAHAHKYLFATAAAPRCDQLSLDALDYAAALSLSNHRHIAARLYCYNRLPVTIPWRQRIASIEAAASFLGSDDDRLGTFWVATSLPRRNNRWFSWQARSLVARAESAVTHKLYVAVHPEELGLLFLDVAIALGQAGAESIKVGNDVYGILRPDKFVAYFSNVNTLRAAAQTLGRMLRGVMAHPVPFTQRIDDAGLLSCAVDPPLHLLQVPWEGASWREWVSNRLALALADAHGVGSTPPSRYALDRLSLEGIDVGTWAIDEGTT